MANGGAAARTDLGIAPTARARARRTPNEIVAPQNQDHDQARSSKPLDFDQTITNRRSCEWFLTQHMPYQHDEIK